MSKVSFEIGNSFETHCPHDDSLDKNHGEGGSEQVRFRPQKSLGVPIERFFASLRFEQREELALLGIDRFYWLKISRFWFKVLWMTPEKAIRSIMRRNYFSIKTKPKCVVFKIATTGSYSLAICSHWVTTKTWLSSSTINRLASSISRTLPSHYLTWCMSSPVRYQSKGV